MERVINSLSDIDRSQTVALKLLRVDPLIKLKKYNGAHTLLGPSLGKRGLPVTGLVEPHETLEGAKVEGTRPQMEKILQMEPGTLQRSSPFWGTYQIRIGSDELRLELNDDQDLLKYLFLRAQSNVAIGLKDAGSSAKHEFVLYSDEEEASLAAKEGGYLRKAYRLADDLDAETKAEILSIYGMVVSTTKISTIETKINEQIASDAKKFLTIADDPALKHKALIRRCLDGGVLHLEDGVVKHGEVEVGMTIPLAAIAVSKNKPLETILKAKLSGDMELIKEALSGVKKTTTKK